MPETGSAARSLGQTAEATPGATEANRSGFEAARKKPRYQMIGPFSALHRSTGMNIGSSRSLAGKSSLVFVFGEIPCFGRASIETTDLPGDQLALDCRLHAESRYAP